MTLDELREQQEQVIQDKKTGKPTKFIECPECKGNLLECNCWFFDQLGRPYE